MSSSSGQRRIEKDLPEQITLERLLKSLEGFARIHTEAVVRHEDVEIPIYSVVLGSADPKAPTLGVFGGVHGLERIGAEVVLAWMQSLSEILRWDQTLRERLEHSRLVFMPMVNPIGVMLTRRSNGNGVDLMRNAPVRAEEEPWWFVGGHSFSPRLPWYSPEVAKEADMEVESRALARVVEREIFPSRLSVSVDVHSGFGSIDRFWFPYAKTRKPPPHIEEITALKKLLDRSYPNHIYRIEPQAKNYTTHGDLWDWLFDRKRTEAGQGLYVPFTLELGSWLWLRKNPRQIFSSLGPFNPVEPHRVRRILRRHLTLFDFLHRAVLSPAGWTDLTDDQRVQMYRLAIDLWYDGRI